MKKNIKLILIIFVLILFFEFIAFIFKHSHEVEYKVETKDHNYVINEVYKDKKYYFLIFDKKNKYKYSFETDNNFHKSKKVVKKIYEYKIGEVLCVYPGLNKKTDVNIVCSKDDKTYSYTYYKNELNDFVKLLKEEGYSSNSWKEDDNYQTKIDTVNVYNKNITDDTYIYIYKYDGFYAINNEENEKVKLFKNDNYNNTLGVQLSKYYIIPDYDQKHDYSKFYIINMKNNKVKDANYKYEISKDSYINGIVDDEIYLFDRDELVQYKIYKNGKRIKEVGNKDDGILYYDLGFKKENVYTFRDEDVTFKTFKDYISKIEKNTSIKFLRNTGDTYYYQTKDNNVYYYNINSKQKVLLLNMKISDFNLYGDTIYFISNDTLYSYNINEGLKKLIVYSEFAFNYRNRVSIYTE